MKKMSGAIFVTGCFLGFVLFALPAQRSNTKPSAAKLSAPPAQSGGRQAVSLGNAVYTFHHSRWVAEREAMIDVLAAHEDKRGIAVLWKALSDNILTGTLRESALRAIGDRVGAVVSVENANSLDLVRDWYIARRDEAESGTNLRGVLVQR